MKPPREGARHHSVELAFLLFKYERQGEFYRISLTAQSTRNEHEAISLLALGWIDELPGKRLAAFHTEVMPKNMKTPTAVVLKKFLAMTTWPAPMSAMGAPRCGRISRSATTATPAMLVHDQRLTPPSLGRVRWRIHEIETYRMTALLAFPLTLDLQKQLGPLEQSLALTIKGMASAQHVEDDAALLARLSTSARAIEEVSNRSSFRFAAARAFSALVEKRVAELGQERASNLLRAQR